MVSLVEISEENWINFAALSVADDQKEYCASNIGIIARGYVYRNCDAKVIGITADGEAVGLALVRNLDEEPACYDLQQFMIDRRYQGKGYGTEALKLILSNLAKEGRYDSAEVCVKKDDAAALHVYEKTGFIDTGYIDEDAPDSLNLMYHF
jgi:RimJ/RimL family protein N-acetyltransferase